MHPASPPAPSDLRAARSILSILEAAAGAGDWLIDPPADPVRGWIRVRRPDEATPAQGWKVHIAATVASAPAVLDAALRVLLDDDATFKVAATLDALASLNEGNGGVSQIGKFVTVYPRDDDHAVCLAVALDRATRDLAGPPIPSDRRLRPGGIVSYRYGGFSTPVMQTAIGEVLPSLITADGRLVPDRRYPWYIPPEGINDPFVAAGVVEPSPPPNLLVADRYALITLVQSSPRGGVYLGVDTREARRVVVKRAGRDALASSEGRDARDRLRAEAAVLTALVPHAGIPAIYDLVEQQESLYLALEDIEGETVEEHVTTLLRHGRFVPAEQVIAWGRQLAAILGHVHERGYVYRDLKSPNVIVIPDGTVRLIDFDMAQPIGDTAQPFGKGTRGYTSPQQSTGVPPAVTDDIYGLGALFYFLCTGAEPSRSPDELNLCSRPVQVMNPAISRALAAVIARCLAPEPEERYQTMAEVGDALARAARGGGTSASARLQTESGARRHARERARRLAETLCALAQPAPGGSGLAWATSHPHGLGGIRTRDINIGSGGALLALAELADELGEPRYRETLREAAGWLVAAPPFAGDPLPGLYVGEAGIGAALLRAGQVLGDAELIAAAIEKGRYVASLPYTCPDLFNGTAGRLRFHLLMWDATRADEHLAAARTAGAVLVNAAERTADGVVRWVISEGYGSMTGTAPLGYAHGTAGIADALLDMVEATGDAGAWNAAEGAARWLAGQAVPSLEDGSGLGWPSTEGEAPYLSWWCHGATGIGRFFLHAAALNLLPQAATVATRAARTVARATRGLAPSQCHGLAGSIEFLLDVYQASGEASWLREARTLAGLLDAYAIERDGNLVYAVESPGVFTPDYMAGFAGVGPCLLRLGDPERRPHQLSRAGFRYRA